MNSLRFLLLCLSFGEARRFEGAKRLRLQDDRWRRQDSCAARKRGDVSRPTHISADECCDGRLANILRQNVAADPMSKLGDTAKTIQRQVQNLLGHSYEVIISRGEFSLSSHYHGQSLCKLRTGNFHVLAYETPVPYNPSNIAQESFLAAIDAEERLGSSLTEGVRGRFPDVRVDPTAGDDLSVQPEPWEARAAGEGIGGGGGGGGRSERATRNGTKLPVGTHCEKERRGGNKCCNGELASVMEGAVREISSSPVFGGIGTLGTSANLIKKRVQQRFDKAFEVFVSNSDFEIASHASGENICKFQTRGITLMAYETPHNSVYDIRNDAVESSYSSISDGDPLGTSAEALPGQRSINPALALEAGGERVGFPRGSHCGDSKLGSRCCNLPIFNSLHSTMQRLTSSTSFNPFNTRLIARELRNAAEDATGQSMETIVAKDDFVVTSHSNDDSCKIRIGEFYVMAYRTPVPYHLHDEEHYADNGPGKSVPCRMNFTEGSSCCNPEMAYLMTRAKDTVTNPQTSNRQNQDAVSRAIVREMQNRFNARFETIVSKGDFSWRSGNPLMTSNICKLDIGEYHVLSFQSSQSPPLPNEFAAGDVASTDFSSSSFSAVNFAQQPVQQIILPQQGPQGIAAQPSYTGPFYSAPVPIAASQCFSEDTWVTTPTGKKNMAQLELGDYVLTANTTAPYFAQVTVWMHRDPEKVAKFTTIMTDYGKMLRLTPRHLIFRNICDDDYAEYIEELPRSGTEVFAHELKKGDCVILLYKGKWRQQRIKEITKTKRKGIYAPLTTNGRILVNDMLASCYSDVKGPTLHTTYFELISFIRQRYYEITGSFADSKIELPFSTNLWKDLMSLILP